METARRIHQSDRHMSSTAADPFVKMFGSTAVRTLSNIPSASKTRLNLLIGSSYRRAVMREPISRMARDLDVGFEVDGQYINLDSKTVSTLTSIGDVWRNVCDGDFFVSSVAVKFQRDARLYKIEAPEHRLTFFNNLNDTRPPIQRDFWCRVVRL
jgi:hypothetical protein